MREVLHVGWKKLRSLCIRLENEADVNAQAEHKLTHGMFQSKLSVCFQLVYIFKN